MPGLRRRSSVWRRRIYQILDAGVFGDRSSQLVHRILIFLVLVNVAGAILQSVPSLSAEYHSFFIAIEVFSLVIFLVEYILRMWVCVEYGPLTGCSSIEARLRHAVSPGMLVDFLAILPVFLILFDIADLRVMLVLRLLRFFKIARYSTGMQSLIDAFYEERRALGACAVILAGLVVISASLMHLAEHARQPDKFGTIPDAMYWAIITLGTVGYGDAVPITPLGKLVASATAVSGLLMVALPVGILATAFSEVIHRRDFVVTWGMVARVPLFHDLNAETIAEIMRLLRTYTAHAGELIVRRGDEAHSMYLIASGAVSIEYHRKSLHKETGDFFGDTALFGNFKRKANVRAVVRTNLLILEKKDIQSFVSRYPEVGEKLVAFSRERLKELAKSDYYHEDDGGTEQI